MRRGLLPAVDVVRFCRFAMVAAIGWALDFGTFWTLNRAGGWIFAANVVAGIVGVSFVFAVSTRRVFDDLSGFRVTPYLIYLAFSAANILTMSAAVAVLAQLGIHPLVCKVLVIPPSFVANFLMMRYLTTRGAPTPSSREFA